MIIHFLNGVPVAHQVADISKMVKESSRSIKPMLKYYYNHSKMRFKNFLPSSLRVTMLVITKNLVKNKIRKISFSQLWAKPFDTWAIQRSFPEHQTPNSKGRFEWADFETGEIFSRAAMGGYVGPPYSIGKVDGPVLVGNYPPAVLVQKGFDSRYAEHIANEKVMNFIDRAVRQSAKVSIKMLKVNILAKNGFKYQLFWYFLFIL